MATKSTSKGYFQGVGRRKTSVAQVRIYPGGKGKITVNDDKDLSYFPTSRLRDLVMAPLVLMSMEKTTDMTIKVNGGGLIGQAEAVRHGISRAIVAMLPDTRKQLKVAGYLRRDPREKERKKPGLRKARKSPQWSKR
jgi:small subunit ribosomal protein S9